MYREEAISILQELHDNSLFSVRTALETLVPKLRGDKEATFHWKLPREVWQFDKTAEAAKQESDINEAAKVFLESIIPMLRTFNQVTGEPVALYNQDQMLLMANFGADWLAGQGKTYIIDCHDGEKNRKFTFEPIGDKEYIVQIRKK